MFDINKVICMDWRGVALERVVVGEGERVYYVAIPTMEGKFSTVTPSIGFPKECVFQFSEGLADQRLDAEEWSKLRRYEGRQGPIRRAFAPHDASSSAAGEDDKGHTGEPCPDSSCYTFAINSA